LLVREGQRVTRGTPLVRLDNPDVAQRVLASRGESAQLAEEQQRNAADLAAAQRERERLRSIVESDARLLKSGAITVQQHASDQASYQQAVEKARQAEAHVIEIENRKRIIDQSTRALESRAASLILRAPSGGVVY